MPTHSAHRMLTVGSSDHPADALRRRLPTVSVGSILRRRRGACAGVAGRGIADVGGPSPRDDPQGDRHRLSVLIDTNDVRVNFVLHPTDLSQASLIAFHHALAVAIRRGAQFTLLHAVGRRSTDSWVDFPAVRDTLARWRAFGTTEALEDKIRRSSVSKIHHGQDGSAPIRQQDEEVRHVDSATAIEVCGAGWWARQRAWTPRRQKHEQIGHVDCAVAVDITRLALKLIRPHVHDGRRPVAGVWRVQIINEAGVAVQIGRDRHRHGRIVGGVDTGRARQQP